jgi:nitrogenase molybdenum-iron protein beta chain
MDIDMRPVYVVSGTPGKAFAERMSKILADVPEAKCKNGANADMFLMHQWIKNGKVDLLMGNTYGKYIARDEDTPLVRVGFPILDRVGHTYFRLLERILNALLDHKDATCPETQVELTM